MSSCTARKGCRSMVTTSAQRLVACERTGSTSCFPRAVRRPCSRWVAFPPSGRTRTSLDDDRLAVRHSHGRSRVSPGPESVDRRSTGLRSGAPRRRSRSSSLHVARFAQPLEALLRGARRTDVLSAVWSLRGVAGLYPPRLRACALLPRRARDSAPESVFGIVGVGVPSRRRLVHLNTISPAAAGRHGEERQRDQGREPGSTSTLRFVCIRHLGNLLRMWGEWPGQCRKDVIRKQTGEMRRTRGGNSCAAQAGQLVDTQASPSAIYLPGLVFAAG